MMFQLDTEAIIFCTNGSLYYFLALISPSGVIKPARHINKQIKSIIQQTQVEGTPITKNLSICKYYYALQNEQSM
jgi:hypothetical protein